MYSYEGLKYHRFWIYQKTQFSCALGMKRFEFEKAEAGT